MCCARTHFPYTVFSYWLVASSTLFSASPYSILPFVKRKHQYFCDQVFFLVVLFFLCSRSGLKYYRREKCCEKSSERQTRLTKFKRLHRYQEAQSIVHLHNDFGTVPKIFPNDWNAFVARQIYSKGNVLSVVWLLMFFCTYRFPNGKIYFCYYIYETF